MKKKVVIEKVPSSKKKVVIEGLPKAQGGTKVDDIYYTPESRLSQAPSWYNWGKGYSETGIPTLPETTGYKVELPKQDTYNIDLGNVGKGNVSKIKTKKPNTTNFKFDIPHIYPLIGNRYLQQAVMDFNDAATFASNIGRQSKDVTLPPATYNPYVNMYYGENGGYLPAYVIGGLTDMYGNDVDESGNVLGVAGVDENGNPISKRPLQQFDGSGNPVGTNFSQPLFNMETGSFQGTEDKSSTGQGSNIAKTIGAIAGTVAKIGSGITHGIKGGLDIAGTNLANRAAQQAENQLYTQSVFSDAMNVTPYETQGYGFQGRNSLAADGMQIRDIGGKGSPTVEVEGKEHIQLPNGFSQEIKGKKHSEGGIPMNLPQGTKIFSEKLKDPATKKSYADLAKKFETKKYVDLLNSKDADPIQKATAEMMIKQRNQKLEELFALQEQNKLSGAHGEQVQFNAMQEQQSQQEPEEPMMMHGGYHLPKAQNGKLTYWSKDMKTPTGISDKYERSPEFWQKWEKFVPGITGMKNVDAQGAIYDWYLKNNPDALDDMWYKYGLTTKGMNDKALSALSDKDPKTGKYTGTFKTKSLDKATLAKLKSAFTDSMIGARLLDPMETEAPISKTPTTTVELEQKPEQKPGTPPATQVVNKPIEMPNMNIGLALPNVYERLPLNYYKIEPEYIDPRYLDIQPQLNRIGRGQRAIESTLGSRGSSDMANLLQAQANRAAAEQEAYGQKYNYDRAQDAAAQQFNAQAKTSADQYNQQSWYQQLEDPIRRRESLIGTQKAMDDQAAIENARQMQAFYGNKDFIGKTFYPAQGWTVQDYLAGLNSPLKQMIKDAYKESKEETAQKEENKSNSSTQTGKYGGRVKKKIKIKMKLRK